MTTGQTCDYHLTVTLKPKLYDLKPNVQFQKTALILHKALLPYKATIIAELTADYNVHYHAIISSSLDRFDLKKKPFDYYVHMIFKRLRTMNFGFIKCDQIQNYNDYVAYMLKDFAKTMAVFDGQVPIVRDDYKLMPAFESLTQSMIIETSILNLMNDTQ